MCSVSLKIIEMQKVYPGTVEDGRRSQCKRTLWISDQSTDLDEVISHLLSEPVRDASMYDLRCLVPLGSNGLIPSHDDPSMQHMIPTVANRRCQIL